MRENRTCGSEGGEAQSLPYPYPGTLLNWETPMRASPAEYNSALRPSSALHDAECKLVLLFPLVFPSPLRPADYKSAIPASPMPGASRRYRAVIRWLWGLPWGLGRLGGS